MQTNFKNCWPVHRLFDGTDTKARKTRHERRELNRVDNSHRENYFDELDLVYNYEYDDDFYERSN